MITVVNKKRPIHGGKSWLYEMSGESTDNKPDILDGNTVGVNSLFLELDTGDFYYLKQQGSSSTTKEDILEETTFEANEPNNNGYNYTTYVYVNNESIKVVFDGTTYTCTQNLDGRWGAPQDGEYQFDFSEYPFSIYSYYSSYPVCIITVADENEHTISIYKEETVVVEPVWEKVGSGGGEPEPTGEKLFDGEVTTVGVSDPYYQFDQLLELNYSSLIVEFEGTRYTVSNIGQDDTFEFGAPEIDSGYDWSGYDWSEFPFNLWYGTGAGGTTTDFGTETAGTYSLKIWANSDPVEPDDIH